MEFTWKKCFPPLFGVALLQFSTSCVFGFGNSVIYIISIMREFGEETDIRYNHAVILFALTLTTQQLISFFILPLEQMFGKPCLMFIGSYMTMLGVLFTYFTVHSFWGFIITYVIMANMGFGITFSATTAYTTYWTNASNTTMITGIMCLLRAISSLFFTILQFYLTNPNNIPPEYVPYEQYPNERYFNNPALLNRLRTFYLQEGFLIFILILIACSFTLKLPDNPTPAKDNEEEDYKRNVEIFKNYKFILLFLLMLTYYTTTTFFQSNWKIYTLQTNIHTTFNDKFWTFFGSFFGIFNLFGRFSFALLDRIFSPFTSLALLLTLYTSFLIAMQMPTQPHILTICICLQAFAYLQGGTLTLFISLCQAQFDKKHVSHVCSLLYNARYISAIILGLVCIRFMDKLQKVGIINIFIFISTISTLLGAIVLIMRPKQKTQNKQTNTQLKGDSESSSLLP